MQFKNIEEFEVYKKQKKLEKINKKLERKEQKENYKKIVFERNNNKCSVCEGIEELKIKEFVDLAILLCKSCRKERKENPVIFYWKFIKKNPVILKKLIK